MPERPFDIELLDDALRGLDALPSGLRAAVTRFMEERGRITPTRPIPGKLKMLKGDWEGYFQLRIDRGRRLIYAVDEVARVVRVEYVGPHPNWRRSRGGRIRP